MKGCFTAVLITIGSLVTILPALAQTDADQAAERQEFEERYKQLKSRFEAMETAHLALQKRVSELDELVRTLKDQHGRDQGKYASAEDLRRIDEKFREKLLEIDKNRQEDLKQIADDIAKLGSTPPSSSHRRPPAGDAGNSTTSSASTGSDRGYEYLVQKGDTLSSIVTAYNAEFKKQGKKTVTIQQVLDANPILKGNPNSIQTGRKILIPMP